MPLTLPPTALGGRRLRPPSPLLVGATAALVAATLLVGTATVVVRGADDDLDHPAAWDPRVADLAAFVEEARDLEFDHPVHVDFLAPEAYTEATTTEVAELQADELEELERGAAELRALGVVSGELDLVATINQATDAGTLAFYSPDDERIRIRGTDLTVGLRVTLVHELTHALQDQHFDLGTLLEDAEDSSASLARRGLGEGDAMRIEDEYVETVLDEEEQAAYAAESESDLERSQTDTAGIPAFIQASFATPYALGAPFVQMLFNRGGNDRIDEAFRAPPSTEEHLFDPASYVAGEEAAPVTIDLDQDDVEILDDGPFGITGWYLVLAERIDTRVAFEAALGWNGDEYVVYQRDGVTCVRAAFRGHDDEQDAEMAAALADWARAMPGGRGSAVEVEGRPGIDACDPGPDVDLQVTGRSLDALALPNLFGYLVAEIIADTGAEVSRCMGAAIAKEVPIDRLTDPAAVEEIQGDIAAAASTARITCRAGDG